MAQYRVYFLTRTNRIMDPPLIVECEDDAAATEKARQVAHGESIEVWECARMVAKIQLEQVLST